MTPGGWRQPPSECVAPARVWQEPRHGWTTPYLPYLGRTVIRTVFRQAAEIESMAIHSESRLVRNVAKPWKDVPKDVLT